MSRLTNSIIINWQNKKIFTFFSNSFCCIYKRLLLNFIFHIHTTTPVIMITFVVPPCCLNCMCESIVFNYKKKTKNRSTFCLMCVTTDVLENCFKTKYGHLTCNVWKFVKKKDGSTETYIQTLHTQSQTHTRVLLFLVVRSGFVLFIDVHLLAGVCRWLFGLAFVCCVFFFQFCEFFL